MSAPSSNQDAAPPLIYPVPPPWYKLYNPGHQTEVLPPAPPPTRTDKFTVFGAEVYLDQPVIPAFAGNRLYNENQDGSIDFKGELIRLSEELLLLYLESLKSIVEAPGQYASTMTLLNQVVSNMQQLINTMRPQQARANLEYVLQLQANSLQEQLDKLRQRAAGLHGMLAQLNKALSDAEGDTAESAPMQL